MTVTLRPKLYGPAACIFYSDPARQSVGSREIEEPYIILKATFDVVPYASGNYANGPFFMLQL